ncbi:PKD domain-containing protein, partial [Candidatus Woesearchaeota archaeon]|nr:PKD domain-containing protein [Candidatus Woesearchaeota archaeon]
MNKGQITLFIILGIVILSIFIFLFTITASVSENRLERQRENAVSGALDATVIQRYASICVDDALKTGLELIGYQGGTLFEGQLGGISTPDHVSFDGHDVSFGITRQELYPPQLYPCSSQFASQPPAFCRYPRLQQGVRFGQSRLPLLESPDGALSIQKQLERYIAEYVRQCVDIPRLQEEEGLRAYTLTEGIPVVEVIFRNADVVATVDYPLSVSIGGEEPVTQFIYFEAWLPVRFRHIYDALEAIIQKDISDVGYDLQTEAAQELPFSYAFPNPLNLRYESLGQDGIFIIEDPSSVVDGNNYVFQSARQNRPPALEYINRYESQQDVYDYLLIAGETADFTARAGDPDEDPVTYEFYGELGAGTGSHFNHVVPEAGYYTVTMTAADGALSDGQDIRVLADHKLQPDFIIDNGYADVPDQFVSIEDPFFLDASATKKTLDPSATYSLAYTFLGGTSQTPSFCSIIPSYEGCEPGIYDTARVGIDEIDPVGAMRLGVQDITLHTRLAYNGLEQSDSTTRQVEVKECLPHRNQGTAPYPYNEEDANTLYPNNPTPDPFQADHACCTDNFAIADSDTVCYKLEQCGHPEATLLSRRNRLCNGNRGNVCEGDWSADWDNLNTCGFNGQNECSGIADAPDGGCQGFAPYAVRPINGLWCTGPTGCEQLGCGKVAILGPLFGIEIGGIDSDGSGKLDSAQDYCGCTEADVDNQRACFKDGLSEDGDLIMGIC